MAIEIEPPEPDLSNIRKHLRPAPSLRRLFGWGGLASLALGALAITSQTKGGSERLQQAIATVATEPVRVVEKDAETRRLEAKLRVLEADRDRLTSRIASLERNLDDMTGSIKKQAERTVAAVASAPASPPPAIAAPATVAPVIATPATAAPAAAPSIVAMNTPPAATPPADAPAKLAPLAMPPIAAPQPSASRPSASQPSTPQPSAPPIQNAAPAAAPITEPVPLPPVRIASAPAVEPAAAPARFQFGIDLGGSTNVDGVRARWAAVKANFGPLLGGLHPVAARDRRTGSTDYRLVVGPLPNVNAARQLCERFAGQAACRPAKYDGEALVQR